MIDNRMAIRVDIEKAVGELNQMWFGMLEPQVAEEYSRFILSYTTQIRIDIRVEKTRIVGRVKWKAP